MLQYNHIVSEKDTLLCLLSQPSTNLISMPFSVLMSLYWKERQEFLRLSLESVFNQSLAPDEVVLVEDGPVDEELERVVSEFSEAHPEMKVVRLPENGGLGKALNEGLRHCSHELVARMDTDDISMPSRFERQVNFMERHPEVAACSSWIQEFEGTTSNIKSVKKVPESPEENARYIKSRSPLNHPAVMFRKSDVESVGSYMHFPLFEDWYLWARLAVKGMKLANLQECLLYFRVSDDVYRRRGGWKYACDNFRFQMELMRIGLISLPRAIMNGVMRAVVYLMPNGLRAVVYNHLLRS